MTAIINSPHIRRTSIEWISLILVLLALSAILGIHLYWNHVEIEAQEKNRLASQAELIEKNLVPQLYAAKRAIDSIQNDLPVWLARKEGMGPANSRLEFIADTLTGISVILITDAKGRVIAANRKNLIGFDASKRDYFQAALKNRDSRATHVASPFVTATGTISISLIRKITNRNGQFGGVIVAALDQEYFGVLMESARYFPDVVTYLAHGDGKLFLMRPENKELIGRDLTDRKSFFSRHQASGRPASLMEGVSLTTGEERFAAMRTIRPAEMEMDTPLVLGISRNRKEIFEAWRRDLGFECGALFLLSLVAALSLFVYQRRRGIVEGLMAEQEAKRKEAEEALKESEQRYRTVADYTSDWEYWMMSDGTFRYISPSCREISGYGPEEFTADPQLLLRIIHPDDLDRYRGHLHRFSANGLPEPVDFRIRNKQGEYRWISHVCRATFDAAGKENGRRASNRDITGRKRSEEEMRRASALLLSFMNAINESACLIDREGRILLANETLARRLNKTPVALVGAHLEDLLPADLFLSRMVHVEKVVGTKNPVRFEDERMGRNIDNVIYPVFDPAGEVHELAIIGHDITERKQAVEALQEERRRLRQALDEVRTLRGIVPICSYCKRIRDDQGYWDQVEQYVSEHTEAKFSHGVCPACYEKVVKEFGEFKKGETSF